MSKIAIIGSGFVGRAWSISFARAGHDIALWDQDPQAPAKALDYIAGLLPDLGDNNLLSGAAPATIRERMHPASSLEEAVDGASYIQESTPENVEVKRAVFARLDSAAAPEAILASSTSSILPSAFTETLKGRERCLVVHPINPPYLIPAAEIVPAPWTEPATIERAAAFLRDAGHAPIVMKREIDGFVMNRMQGALLEEAFRLVADGYASVEDIDVGICDGLACAGRSWGLLRRSISIRRAACETTPTVTRASMRVFSFDPTARRLGLASDEDGRSPAPRASLGRQTG
jgi:3-hydroxyacyl-CoA dehydrogenase